VSVTAATPVAADASPLSKATNLLQRVIFPRAGEPLDVRSLYLIESPSNSGRAHAPTRTTVVLGAESEVSFETYFNGFAASYWRRWSILTSVVLRVEVRSDASQGQTRPDRVACRVDVYRSKSDGSRIGIEGGLVHLDDDNRGVIEFEVDLGPFEDGG
jgi:galactofuranosylgalactofuranosylrhamnosyl-N-acetylglucosaminyl-diphospho-decaprenol beta-1,5/1,6-galactofuranosyltransferase